MSDARDTAGGCAAAHPYLLEAMMILDRGLGAAAHRERRGALIEHGTCACAFARLDQEADMRVELTAMLTEALALPLGAPDEREIVQLRRAIRMALAEPQQDGRGH